MATLLVATATDSYFLKVGPLISAVLFVGSRLFRELPVDLLRLVFFADRGRVGRLLLRKTLHNIFLDWQCFKPFLIALFIRLLSFSFMMCILDLYFSDP